MNIDSNLSTNTTLSTNMLVYICANEDKLIPKKYRWYYHIKKI